MTQQQQQQRIVLETPISRIMSSRTHARSASHGGVLASSGGGGTPSRPGNSNWMGAPVPTPRPSALKKPGHQRAFSQGQVVDVQRGQPVSGHSRVGSKTDFILPPGHREEGYSSGGAAAGVGAPKAPSFRGHSRQASRSESIYTIRRSAAPPWWRRAWARCFGSVPEEPPLRTIVPNHLLPPDAPPSKQIHASTVDNRYFFLFFRIWRASYSV